MGAGPDRPTEGLPERVDGIAAWIHDLDERVRAAELATGDEKTARELRRAIEALSKHDPKLEKRLTNRVDVLADRLATLASTVSTAAASLARKDGEIAALRRELEEGNRRVEGLVKQLGKGVGADEVEKLRAAIKAVQADRPARSADARVDDLNGKVAFLNERVDTLATTVATTAAGLVGREGEIANLRQRLDHGAARIEQAATEIRQLQGSSTLADRLDTLQGAIDQTTAGLAERAHEVTAVRARIDEAYSRVGTVVAELQTSIAALSAQVVALESLPATTEQALETRAEELHARLDVVTASVESAARGVAENNARVEALGTSVEGVSERVDTVADELRDTLDRLPEPGAIDPAVDERLTELAASVAGVTEELSAVATASSAQAGSAIARAAAAEELLGQVGERLDALERDRDAAAEEVTRAAEAWTEEREWVRGRLEALAEAQADATEARESFGPAIGELAARLNATDSERTAVAAEVARLSQALESEQNSLRAELEGLAGALAAAAADDTSERSLNELAGRVDSLEGSHAAAGAEIARFSNALEAEHRSLRAELEGLAEAVAAGDSEQVLSDMAGRVDSLEGNHAAASAELARFSNALEAEQRALRAELAALASGLAEAAADDNSERALNALAARLDATESERTAVAAEVARLSKALEAEHNALRGELGALASTLETAASGPGAGQALTELLPRLDKVERHGAAVASEVARTTAFWATQLEAIEAKLDGFAPTEAPPAPGPDEKTERVLGELAARVDSMEDNRQAVSSLDQRLHEVAAELAQVAAATRREEPAPSPAAEEVAELRVAVDGLRMRLASSEQELATLVGSRDLATRIDEVTRRLESVERAPIALATADGGSLPGDGRFRLELRALELRMEHAEAAARENREAVLVQLERLAARIEWRFQRLEAEYETRHPQAAGGGGQVVPLRPPAEV